MVVRKWLVWLICIAGVVAATLVGCASVPTAVDKHEEPRTETLYVISRDWHTDIGLPVDSIHSSLGVLRQASPGARYLVFGFGDRQYLMARQTTFADMLLALFPGPGVMLVTALRASPSEAFGARNVVALGVSRAEVDRVSQFLWGYFDKDPAGLPLPNGDGPYPGSTFYASNGTYDAAHTCNTWTIEALQVGGLPVNATGVVFAEQVMEQAQHLAALQAGSGSSRSTARN